MGRVLLAICVAAAFLVGKNPTIFLNLPPALNEVRGGERPQLDIYGNEVERAVGGYRVDRQGDMYEEHEPGTAVLRLGPPSS